MEIPRGHAMLPLNESDFLDFIYNYFKAEYAPIRSFWSTATADPRQPQRWINMGHELQPLSVRPANAQAQKDLESLDYFARKWRLDSGFVRGLVVRFAKYEVHDRLEKKLFESARLDLMVRKSLKEKHLIDALWPSPAPRSEPKDLLAQGVQVRRWYGDMFAKYFTVLHSVDEFELRPEVDQRIKSSGTLMLIPFVDHLVIGAVDPIVPIVARGAGYASNKALDSRGKTRSDGYGEPGLFEIRFDAPAQVDETFTKSVVRQCQCLKCGAKRDVQVVISVDPNLSLNGAAASASRQSITTNASVQRRLRSGEGQDRRQEEAAPPQPPRPQPESATRTEPRPSTPEEKKQCQRCTFLNHASLTECEMCGADLPEATITKPPSPAAQRISHSHSASLPPPTTAPDRLKAEDRPGPPNRHSLSSTLFSIFPFSQQHQQEHHAKLPATQQTEAAPAVGTSSIEASRPEPQRSVPKREGKKKAEPALTNRGQPVSSRPHPSASAPSPPDASGHGFITPPTRPESPKLSRPNPDAPSEPEPEPHLSQPPEMAMMPLTPPPSAPQARHPPAGLPSHLMDEYIPPSPSLPVEDEEEAGWAELRRRESTREEERSDSEDGEEGDRALVDLDAVAREEMGVWGEREDD
ncbi:EAP30/Vps36 family protein [Stagonosporopsis vannaccii]|nr:EAP30/Vps36 family protein [Stagonosporopsis vannaccii]